MNPAIIEALISEIDKKLDKRFGAIERHLAGIDRDLSATNRQVDVLLHRQGIGRIPEADEGEAIAQADESWQCVKCGSRLGYYDRSDDTLRIRHKDLTLWVQVGLGGRVSVVCRSCGELNTVEAESPVTG